MLAISAVIISTFSAAYLIIHKEIKHCQNLDFILRLINAVKNKAIHYGMPFAEIISELQNNDDFAKSVLIQKFCSSLSEGKTVPEAWKIAVDQFSKYIESHECDTLIRYGEEMCRCNKDEISELSANILYELQEYRNIAVEKRNMKSKSTAAVTISSGIVIVLMFA